MRRLTMIFAILFLLVIGVAAQDMSGAHVRIAHFSPDAGSVDLYVDGALLAEEVNFGDVTEWESYEAGKHVVTIVPTGETADNSVLDVDVSLNDGDWVTVAVIGEAARDTLSAQVLLQDYSPTNEGETRVTFFNAIPDGRPVDFYANDVALAVTVGYPGFLGPDSDGMASSDIVAGTYTLSAKGDDGSDLAAIEDVTLGAGRYYLFAAVGLAADPQYVFVSTDLEELMAPAEEPIDPTTLGDGSAMVRVAHLAPGAGEVDVYLNGEATDLTAVDFATVSDWFELPAGVYTVQLVPAGGSVADAVLTQDVGIATDNWVTLAAIGYIEKGSLEIQPLIEDFSSAGVASSRISFFHAIPDLEPVNLYADDTALAMTVGYPGYVTPDSDGFVTTEIVTDTYQFTITLASAPDTVLVDVGEITLGSDRNYFIALINTAAEPLFLVVPTDIP